MSLVDFGVGLATGSDAIRLVLIPVFVWIAWRDIKTRRIPNRVWSPLVAAGMILLLWDTWEMWGTANWNFFAVSVALSLVIVIPAAFLLWLIGGFGGADAKAIMMLAIVFPTYPSYYIDSTVYPVTDPVIGSFAFTVLTNAVVLAVLIPIAIGVINITRQDLSFVMLLGQKKQVTQTVDLPGKVLETPTGHTRSGLDLDVLRMYLQWRGASLEEIRYDPSRFRNPVTIPENPNPVGDGAVSDHEKTDADQSTLETGEKMSERKDRMKTVAENKDQQTTDDVFEDNADWWGAEAFIDDVGYAYGTTPPQIRNGLEVLVEKERVWVSPGLPFMVLLFAGLLTALVYGNLLFALFETILSG